MTEKPLFNFQPDVVTPVAVTKTPLGATLAQASNN